MPYYEVNPEDIDFYEQLGAGTYGSVYRALWKSQQKVVAVKKLLVLEKEAEVLSTLSHRHIVQFYGACTVAPNFCILTEFADNGCLFYYLEKNIINFKQLLLWAKQIGLGLNYLHMEAPAPVIHRDLKSKNVVIAADLTVKICDFGSSKFHKNTTKMTLTGTFPWMSPEMIQQLPVSSATDVFSYGVVLWELLTHEVPFRGLEGLSVAWLVVGRGVDVVQGRITAHHAEIAPALQMPTLRLTIPESCPKPFATLMARCWETDIAKRPTSKDILSNLEVMLQCVSLEEETDIFINRKEEWKKEIDDKLVALKAMERQLSDKEKELQEKEKELEEKEKKLNEKTKSKTYEPFDANGWSEEEVADWVYNIGYSSESGPGELSAYAELFRDHHITGRRLFRLNGDDLLQIGIFAVGHRRDLLDEVQSLKTNNQRLLHFPPLNTTDGDADHPPKPPSRSRSCSIRGVSLTLVYGNLFRKGKNPKENKWKVFVDPDGDTEARNCINNVVFIFSKSIPEDISTMLQPPYMMESWKVTSHPGLVECIVQYKEHVFKPKRTKWSFSPQENCLQEEITIELEIKHSLISKELHTVAEAIPNAPGITSGLLVPMGTSPPKLHGKWKDREIFQMAPMSETDICSTTEISKHPMEKPSRSVSAGEGYRGPNLKGAWAVASGAQVLKMDKQVQPVQELGYPPAPLVRNRYSVHGELMCGLVENHSGTPYPIQDMGTLSICNKCGHHQQGNPQVFHHPPVTYSPVSIPSSLSNVSSLSHLHPVPLSCQHISRESSRASSHSGSYSSQESLVRTPEKGYVSRGGRNPAYRRQTTGNLEVQFSRATGYQHNQRDAAQMHGVHRSQSDGTFVKRNSYAGTNDFNRSQSDRASGPNSNPNRQSSREQGRGGRGGRGRRRPRNYRE